MSLETQGITLPESIRQAAIPEPAYECQECRDRGWIMRDDGGAGTLSVCSCRSAKDNPALCKRRLQAAGLEESEIIAAWTPWDEKLQPRPHFARQWLTWALCGGKPEDCPTDCRSGDPPHPPRSPWSLCLMGLPGRGKTKTAATLARIYVEGDGLKLIWARAPEAFDAVQGERAVEGVSETERRIVEAPLLILDELGMAHRRDVEALNATVDEWLAARERRRLPTVVTTNAESLSMLDPRIASRLAAGVYREMAGEDARDFGP